MKNMKLQDLLAPTWRERARADDALLSDMMGAGDITDPWPEEVQSEIRALKPSPEIFLSALVAFWADVAAREFVKRLAQAKKKITIEPDVSSKWSSPHLSLFPMTPPEFPGSVGMMRGIWVWNFIKRLGFYAGSIEPQLVACLKHPEPGVHGAAESALGTADSISDEAFGQLLAAADLRGRDGQAAHRAQAIFKHAHGPRAAMILKGLEPDAPANLVSSRLAIIRQFTNDNAAAAYQHLQKRIKAPWPDRQLSEVIYGLLHLSEKLGFDKDSVAAIKQYAKHSDPWVLNAVAAFLSTHSPSQHYGILNDLINDPKPWILTALCYGFERNQKSTPDLLRKIISLSLGNYKGHDGEPHLSAVGLLKKMGGSASIALPEILEWLERSSANYRDRDVVLNVLDIADAMGAAAKPFTPYLERFLAILATPEKNELDDLPTFDQPGAVPKIQAGLEKAYLKSGANPDLAHLQAKLDGAVLNELSKNLDSIKADMEKFQSEYNAEQRDLYPERFTPEAAMEQEPPVEALEEEDELVKRLRATIEKLRKTP